jgi:uncharacterized protein (TIGR02246 family)
MNVRLVQGAVLLNLAIVVGSSAALGQQSGVVARSAAAAADEKAIRAADDAFVRSYNQGDSKALAALFTEDADVIEHTGDRYQGRQEIQRRLADAFAADPGLRLSLEIESIRFPHPDVACEEGRSVLVPAQGPRESRLYTALYVKRDGQWLISSVREEADPVVRPHDRLKELEWMVGDWVDEGSDSELRLSCSWSEDGNFLIRAFTVKRQGKPFMSVTQRIGWDPLARQFHSWEFDSEGGFGEGRWSRDGQRWVVKHTGVRPEGTSASATNIMTRQRADMIRWVSLDRAFGSESVPDEESFVLVRVPPQPRLKLQAPPPTSTPNSTRSPR